MTVVGRLRTPYEVGWQVVTGATIAVGLVSVTRSSPGPAAAVWLIVAMIAAAFWLAQDLEDEPALARATMVGAESGAVAVAAVGLVQVCDAGAVGIIASLVAGSPHVLDRLAARFGHCFPQRGRKATTSSRPPHLVAYVDVGLRPAYELHVTDALTDEDLCLAWRSTFVALSRAATTESRVRTAEIRALILDELDRRNGQGLRSWLDSGARAASDPQRHLCEHPR